MDFPKDLRYTKNHEWTRAEDGTYVIGISAFAVEQLGDITLVDLPEEDDEIAAGEVLGTIESVKSVSDLFAPMDCTVIKVNEALEDAPELVNEKPYGDGWLVVVKADAAGFEALLDSATYETLVAEQS